MNRIINVGGELAYECLFHENYFVTKSGKLYSILLMGGQGTTDITKPRLVKSKFTNDGYLEAVLSNNKRKTYIRLHRLIARQFLGEIKDGQVINHKDGNKLNNSVDNLEIVSVKRNVIHAIETGLIVKKSIKVIAEFEGQTTFYDSYAACIEDLSSYITSTYFYAVKENYILPHYLYLKWNNLFYGDFSISTYWNTKLYKTFDSPMSMDKFFDTSKNYTLKVMQNKNEMYRRELVNKCHLIF